MGRAGKFDNLTLDVLNKGCLDSYDSVACGRISILIFLNIITFFFVIVKIVKYHSYKHSQMHHYVIFYVSAFECIISSASFIVGNRYPQLHFATIFLKLYQFILICHLHWSMAARSRHREDIVQHVINPVLCLYTLYYITVVLMGMVDISGTWTECFKPYWIMLSSGDLIAVQLFVAIALYVAHSNRKLVISALMMPVTSSQTKDLWLVTAAYEISAIISYLSDAVVIVMGKNESGCSGVYNHEQTYYSAILAIILILKYFVPTWTLLWVFQPSTVKSRPSEVALTSHYVDGSYHNQYHKNYLPKFGSTGSIPYPALSYATNSPMFGAIEDFSDSSPDASPTVARYWTGLKNEDPYSGYEKYFINMNQEKEIMENHYRMEQNRQILEKSLGLDSDNENNSIDNNRYLTTINEESANNTENPPE